MDIPVPLLLGYLLGIITIAAITRPSTLARPFSGLLEAGAAALTLTE